MAKTEGLSFDVMKYIIKLDVLSQSKGKILIMIKSLLYKWVYTNIVCSMCD